MRTIQDITQGEPLEEVLLKARVDPKFFMDNVLGFQYPTKKFHIEWFNAFRNNKRTVIVAPRGFGKTEVTGVAFFLWIAMFEREKTMIIVSKTVDMGKEIIARIRRYIESNELLHSLKPEKAELTWTKTELHTTTGCRCIVRPYGANIRTWHVHYLLTDEAAYYEDKSSFYFDILPIINAHDGNLMVISTPQTMTDLVAELSKKPMYKVMKYQAIMSGKAIWPERFPIRKLNEIKKEQGELKFTREYMCEVVSSDIAIFPPNLIMRACDDNDIMYMNGDKDEIYYFGADFAMAAHGNYSVFIVLKRVGNKLKVEYMQRPKRGTDPKIQEMMIKEIYKKFNIVNGYGDVGSFGAVIVNNLIADGINIQGFDFQKNKHELIMNLRRKFENDQIVIPTCFQEPYTKAMSDILIKELSEIVAVETKTGKETYRGVGAHDDSVMALALAAWAADEIKDADAMIEVLDE